MSLDTNDFEFADFSLNTGEQVLYRGENPVAITPKAIHLLFVLVKNTAILLKKPR